MIFSGGEPHILTLVTTQKWEILRERETVGTDYPKPLRNDTGPSPWTDQKVVRTPAPPLVLIKKLMTLVVSCIETGKLVKLHRNQMVHQPYSGLPPCAIFPNPNKREI